MAEMRGGWSTTKAEAEMMAEAISSPTTKASENLGMAMIYTLVTSAKEWLSERFCRDATIDSGEEDETEKEDIVIPHGEPVTVETFLAWTERFEAELALE